MADILNVAGVVTLLAVGWAFAGCLGAAARKIWFEGTHVRDGTELRKKNW